MHTAFSTSIPVPPQKGAQPCSKAISKKNIPRCGPRQCGQDSRLPPAGGGWRGEPCGRHPPPRLFAIGAAPHLASPRWGEVHTPSTGRKPGEQGAKTRGESFLEIT